MNDKKEMDFSEYLIKSLELKDLPPLERFAKMGNLFKNYSKGGLRFDKIINEFELLEKDIGRIPILAIIENQSAEFKEKYYEFYITEYLNMSVKSIPRILSFASLHVEEETKQEEKKEKNLLNLISDLFSDLFNYKGLVEQYIQQWEVFYNILVNPIYTNIKTKNLLPEDFIWSGRHSEIQAVMDFLGKNDNYSSLQNLFEPMNTELRNAFVHLDYYIDSENKEVVIFNKKSKKQWSKTIPIREIEQNTLILTTFRLILLVNISYKLCKQLGIEWD